MSGALKSIPGLVQTIIDRLTTTRAAALDNLDDAITSRAPAATALSTAVWTPAHADALASAAQERDLAVGGLLGGSTAGFAVNTGRFAAENALIFAGIAKAKK